MINVKEWQDRLAKYFTVNDIIGGELVEVIKKEMEYGDFVTNTFHGQNVLMDSFFGFFINTFKTAIGKVNEEGWPEDLPYYPVTILYYLTMFRRFRAAENLCRCGYPFDGYSLLRDLKDRSIFIAAIAHGKTNLEKIIGDTKGEELTEETYRKVKNRRKKEEYKILKHMIRENSGFDSETLKELTRWENLFHEEVHGSKMTFFSEMRKWRMGEPLSIGPVPVREAYGMYLNRAAEIGWLITRIFPLLQITPKAFPKTWREKWDVLDDSFRIMVKGLEGMGKKIATAFICFVDTKFPFTPNDQYKENNN
jgi:hypothetical protein